MSDGDDGHVEVVWAAPNDFASGWHFPAHAHADAHELIVVREGRLRTAIAGALLEAGPGTAVWHPPGVRHEEWSTGPGRLRTAYLCWRGPLPAALCGAPCQVDDRYGRLEAALRWACDLLAEGTPAARAAAAGLIAAVIQEYAAAAAGRGADLVRRVRAHLRAHLADDLGLDDLARAAGMGRSRFAAAFRRAAGTTPMRFLRDLRVAEARHLLLTTTLTVEAVARRVGFADRFHFSRVFSRATGRAPSALRGG